MGDGTSGPVRLSFNLYARVEPWSVRGEEPHRHDSRGLSRGNDGDGRDIRRNRPTG